jgi:hypothetical protein
MKTLLESGTAEIDRTKTEDGDAVIDLTDDHAGDLRDFVRRVRDLLARDAPKDCPPGHWLG